MDPKIIIALDFDSGKKALDFTNLFDEKLYVKVGMELFYSEGLKIVRDFKAAGHDIFLDLKLHDIPNTVNKSMKVLASAGVDMVNVHAAGGSEMMRAAKAGLEAGASGECPLLIAVTQLTSTNREIMNGELLIPGEVGDVVRSYAVNAKDSGLDGVVCSAFESPLIHEAAGDGFLTVTPGIRLEGDSKGDQKRVATPALARELGSDYLVIGRSITAASDPVAAYRRALAEVRG